MKTRERIEILPKANSSTLGIHTAEQFYQSAENYLLQAKEHTPAQIGRPQEMATLFLWHSLVLGYPKAAYSLYESFSNGLGVAQDDYIALLMYGVALNFNDERCTKKGSSGRTPIFAVLFFCPSSHGISPHYINYISPQLLFKLPILIFLVLKYLYKCKFILLI